jgi:preprotein translocase subunit SecG
MSFVMPAFAVVPVTTAALFVAQQAGTGGSDTDTGGQGEDFGKSSPVGFLLLIVFLVAVAFLIRSMTKHLKRVPVSFDPDEVAAAEAAAQAPAESGKA